jgi:hypothetical protein
MLEYLELGTCPSNEDCIQVNNSINYIKPMLEQCTKYENLLITKFPPIDNTKFVIKGFNHDFGKYYEVCIQYNPNDEKAVEFAFNVESNLPETW